MRIVVLSLTDPYRAAHGGTLRTRALAGAFARLGHEVAVVFPRDPSAESLDPAAAGGEPPPPGVSVLPVASSTVGSREWPEWVRRVKRELVPLPTALGGRSAGVRAALAGLAPVDLLVVSVLPFSRYVQGLPGARLWVDHSDLYSDVVAREAARRTGLARRTARLQLRGVVRAEDRLARDAAVTTAAGWVDADALQARARHEVAWLPTPVRGAVVERAASQRPAAGFFANFEYWPNLDALELLRERWAPRLHELGWDVVVAGLGSDRVDAGPHARVLGPVPTPADFYRQVDLTVAPVRLGGGMKVKVVESLANGRPVLATAFAVAGFPEGFGGAVDVVDVDRPDFSGLAGGPPPVPRGLDSALAPFTPAGFDERVGELLDRRVASPAAGARR